MVDSLYRQLIKLLKDAGCSKFREGKGSHEIWLSPNGKHLVIPSNVNNKYLANGILKDAGLPKSF